MTDDDIYEQPVSQNFKYCVDIYRLMVEEGKKLSTPDGDKMHVWEGFFTKLVIERMNLSVPYYSTVRRELMRMGCIRQLRRGGGSSPSQWELLREPTEELWNSAPAKSTRHASKQEAASGQIQDLARRLSRMEENFEVLIQALAENGGKIPFDEPKQVQKQYEVIDE